MAIVLCQFWWIASIPAGGRVPDRWNDSLKNWIDDDSGQKRSSRLKSVKVQRVENHFVKITVITFVQSQTETNDNSN
jgi:hypothetical protein